MRKLDWPDCGNVRDLGGLGEVRVGRLVRSDNLDQLTPAGLAAVADGQLGGLGGRLTG